jgi:hypothetical protein
MIAPLGAHSAQGKGLHNSRASPDLALSARTRTARRVTAFRPIARHAHGTEGDLERWLCIGLPPVRDGG